MLNNAKPVFAELNVLKIEQNTYLSSPLGYCKCQCIDFLQIDHVLQVQIT